MIPSTPCSRPGPGRAASLTVQTYTWWPPALQRGHQLGAGPQKAIAGAGDPGAERQPGREQARREHLEKQHRGQAGGQFADPPHRERGERHDRDLDGVVGSGLGQPVPAQQPDQPALDVGAVREGCLVSMSSRTGRSAARTADSSRSRVSSRARSGSGGKSESSGGPVPRGEVERVQLGQGARADPAASVAGAVEAAVVHADQVPVAGQPDVALQPVGALVERAQVCGEGVLGQRRGGAAVGEDEWRCAHLWNCSDHAGWGAVLADDRSTGGRPVLHAAVEVAHVVPAAG